MPPYNEPHCMRFLRIASLLAAAAVVAGCAPKGLHILDPFEATVRVRLAKPATLERYLAAAPPTNEQRALRTKQLFYGAGCRGENLIEQPVRGTGLGNLICVLPGRSDERIVVAAHYERRVGAEGVIDNWSGLLLLPSLYWALASEPREHTYVFLATSDFSTRARGAREYVRSLAPDELERTRAVVALYGIGLRDLAGWGRRADPNLWLDLQSVVQSTGTSVRNASFLTPIHDEARFFKLAGAPTILLHSFDYTSSEIITRDPTRDRRHAIDPRAYQESYRTVAYYLAYLDASLTARRLAPQGDEFGAVGMASAR